MKYVKRKCSNAGKVSLPNFKMIQEVFLADIAAEVLINGINDQLGPDWSTSSTNWAMDIASRWGKNCANSTC